MYFVLGGVALNDPSFFYSYKIEVGIVLFLGREGWGFCLGVVSFRIAGGLEK